MIEQCINLNPPDALSSKYIRKPLSHLLNLRDIGRLIY